jgi:hypothetical protein
MIDEMSAFDREWSDTLEKLKKYNWSIEQIEAVEAIARLFFFTGYNKSVTDVLNVRNAV